LSGKLAALVRFGNLKNRRTGGPLSFTRVRVHGTVTDNNLLFELAKAAVNGKLTE
jgi:hypothetical protein